MQGGKRRSWETQNCPGILVGIFIVDNLFTVLTFIWWGITPHLFSEVPNSFTHGENLMSFMESLRSKDIVQKSYAIIQSLIVYQKVDSNKYKNLLIGSIHFSSALILLILIMQ